ncbi:HemK/PrmC family methyltransferase [Candidatus Ferrigenium straubiae]|jgi:release factor glutamine methyltransferase|uniref:HemK/PrmC family methyltransferase n=1 Tax=Candidatus Ferrigenium straubiae TaxID=2919506 RepID=UPI003F4A9544
MPYAIQSFQTQNKAVLESALALNSNTARIEVQMLLQQVLGVSRAHLLAHPEQVLDDAQEASYRALLQRRLKGEPLAYILGEREFFGLNFKVTPATLIPRPETELLVELALERIPSPLPLSREREREERSGGRGAFRVLDLGTGSGAIALAIARARPDVEVTAVDASPEALEVARENALRLLVQHEPAHISTKPLVLSEVEGSVRTDILIANVRLLCSDWFSALAGERFDLIVSNPPYIAEGDAHLAQGDLRFEPHGALASGADGLDDIRRIVAQAKDHLNPGGWLLFEHGYDQATRVRELLDAAEYAGVFSARDLADIERVSGGAIPR